MIVTDPSGPRETFTVTFDSGVVAKACRSKKRGPWTVTATYGQLCDAGVATFGGPTHWTVVAESIRRWDTRDFSTPGHTWTLDFASASIWDTTTGAIRTGYEPTF